MWGKAWYMQGFGTHWKRFWKLTLHGWWRLLHSIKDGTFVLEDHFPLSWKEFDDQQRHCFSPWLWISAYSFLEYMLNQSQPISQIHLCPLKLRCPLSVTCLRWGGVVLQGRKWKLQRGCAVAVHQLPRAEWGTVIANWKYYLCISGNWV